MTRDHRTARRQFAAQYEDVPLGSLKKSSSTMSQDSALIIVMDASVSGEGRTNVLLTVVLLNMTDGVVHLLWNGVAFLLVESPISMSSKMGH